MVNTLTNKKIIQRFESVRNPKVRAVLLKDNDEVSLCSFQFMQKHEKEFREIMPTYYDKHLENYEKWDTTDSDISRGTFMAYMCLETGVVDLNDFHTVVHFTTAGLDVKDLKYYAPSSVDLFSESISRTKNQDLELLQFLDEKPEYFDYFVSLMCSVESDHFSVALSKRLQSAGLQDTLRFHILNGMLNATNRNLLLHFLNEIDQNNYYRFKALNEVAVCRGDYTVILPPKDLVVVMRDAANGNYEKYFSADFRHAYHFILTYFKFFEKEFHFFALEVLKRAEDRVRWALFYFLSEKAINEEYIREIFARELTMEDLSFLLYKLDGDSIDVTLLPKVFDSLFTLMNRMNKVNYHYKTDEDITFARDLSKSYMLQTLGCIAARLNQAERIQQLDDIYDTLKEEAQAKYLKAIGKKTHLDIRQCTIRFLKTDNYSALKFFDEQKIKLKYAEAVLVSDFLKTKKESVKSKIIQVYLASNEKNKIISYLLSCTEEYKKAAGLEMQKSLGKVDKIKLQRDTEMFRWTSKSVFTIDEPIDEIEKIASQKLNFSYIPMISYQEVKSFFENLKDFIWNHRDYEYATYYTDGLVLFGSQFSRLKDSLDKEISFHSYPLGEEIKTLIQDNLSQESLAGILLLLHCVQNQNLELYLAIYNKDAKKNFEYVKALNKGWSVMNEYTVMRTLERVIAKELLNESLLLAIVSTIAQENVLEKCRSNLNEFDGNRIYPAIYCELLINQKNTDNLQLLVCLTCRFIKAYVIRTFSLKLTAMAVEQGLISKRLAHYFLLKIEYISELFLPNCEQYIMHADYKNQKFKSFVLEFIEFALNEEFKRGSLQTLYSTLLAHTGRFYGAENFFKAIVALRGLTWVRSPFGNSKNEVLSYILKNTIKVEKDTYESFIEFIDIYHITDDELMKATLFNPEFVDFTATYLKIPNLKLAIFWFIAHLNESLYGEKQERRIEQIKEFSDISYPDFKDGAFDCKWYTEMIEKIPEPVLQTIYTNAKYVTIGGLHKRAQRFFDAMNGKITKKECLEKISSTRNKDFCLIYSLIPIENKIDLYERYVLLSEFARQSKQFGAQRQLSERRTVDIALENLARAAGYASSDLFIFEMESEHPSDIFKEYVVEDITILPYIDEQKYKVSYKVLKNGKTISSIPSKYSKYETVGMIRQQIKILNQKFRRIITSLEVAMNTHIPFTTAQLCRMSRERMISVVLSKVLFITDGILCTFDGKLKSIEGKGMDAENVYVAHAVDLKKYGILSTAIEYIAKQNIRQPFKQVLREIYLKTAEELTQDEVLRFKGFEVDIKKCIAALKGKGWGVSEDIGLRKVYYRSDTVAAIFRECDFLYTVDFTNVNRELHGIFFLKRKSGEIISIKDVDDITFSETLRDVDLMVSISSKVIYDFELAMSTIEMRHEVLKSIVHLLGLNNVSFLKDNIKVEGKLGTYTINIRTGLVFKEGKGNLALATIYSIDKPILLDFVDEDPMTADIISKAIVLANDEAIKDSAILHEIQE